MAGRDDLGERAARAVAGFTSTRSKSPEAMFGEAVPGGSGGAPTHMVRAAGARIETADGRRLLDWTMALGAVGLGYGHPRVVEAAERAVRDGAVGPLPPALEVEVAERLGAGYPLEGRGEWGGGEPQARFFKTGAEAVQGAVRIARAATGRERVVYAGYHGWLDGAYSGVGVPRATEALWCRVPFDGVLELEAAVHAGEPPAIVVLEPVIERPPSRTWLEAARELCAARGVVLAFDEIKTAFRLARGGAAERWGVHPDLGVLGKALANGFPLAAVVGRGALMAKAQETWISSTLATEYVALAAARAVLDVWDEVDVARHLGEIGRLLQEALRGEAGRGGYEVLGMPEMLFLRFADAGRERRFLAGCARRGVLLKRGAYDFPCLAHGRGEVQEALAAVRETVASLA